MFLNLYNISPEPVELEVCSISRDVTHALLRQPEVQYGFLQSDLTLVYCMKATSSF